MNASLLLALLFALPDLAAWERALDPAPEEADAVVAWWPRITQAACALARRPADDATREAWIALHRVETSLYPALDRVAAAADVPLFFDTDHHRAALRWAADALRRGASAPVLVHVDSHPDLGELPAAAVDAARRRDPAGLAALVRNVNQPVALSVLVSGAEQVVWYKPAWAVLAGELDVTLVLARPRDRSRPVASTGGCARDCLAFFHEPADGRRLRDALGDPALRAELGALELRPGERPVDAHFEDARRVRLTAGADPRRLARAVGARPFVLSLDLDAFATNGVPGSPGDPCSPGRVAPQCDGVPRDPALRLAAYAAERRAIDARLSAFAELLGALREAGARPVGAFVAASAFLPRSACADCRSGLDFTPVEWVAFVRHRAVAAWAAAFPDAVASPLATPCPP